MRTTAVHRNLTGRSRPWESFWADGRFPAGAAALELFIGQGYRSTRISDVAARAGVAKGTVYLHFADKQALFAGVISDVLDRRVADLEAARPAQGESLPAFHEPGGDASASRRGGVAVDGAHPTGHDRRA